MNVSNTRTRGETRVITIPLVARRSAKPSSKSELLACIFISERSIFRTSGSYAAGRGRGLTAVLTCIKAWRAWNQTMT